MGIRHGLEAVIAVCDFPPPNQPVADLTHGADISQARGPPLWDDFDAQLGEGVEVEPGWDEAAQSTPRFEVDERINW